MKNTLFTKTDNLVVARGKVFNSNVIKLPEEWEKIVNPKTITVSITPCGVAQAIAVKTIDIKEVKLFTNSNLPIECYYQVLAELI